MSTFTSLIQHKKHQNWKGESETVVICRQHDIVHRKPYRVEPNQQNNKQNITTDIEIKNKPTVTRGEVGGDNGEKKGGWFSGTPIKYTWTKPKGDRIKGGKWG